MLKTVTITKRLTLDQIAEIAAAWSAAPADVVNRLVDREYTRMNAAAELRAASVAETNGGDPSPAETEQVTGTIKTTGCRA
jgi:hypothetical protein